MGSAVRVDTSFLDQGPEDYVERVRWLSKIRAQILSAIEAEFQVTYFDARRNGQLEDVIAVAPHTVNQVYAFTRAENEARGRGVRWTSEQQARQALA